MTNYRRIDLDKPVPLTVAQRIASMQFVLKISQKEKIKQKVRAFLEALAPQDGLWDDKQPLSSADVAAAFRMTKSRKIVNEAFSELAEQGYVREVGRKPFSKSVHGQGPDVLWAPCEPRPQYPSYSAELGPMAAGLDPVVHQIIAGLADKENTLFVVGGPVNVESLREVAGLTDPRSKAVFEQLKFIGRVERQRIRRIWTFVAGSDADQPGLVNRCQLDYRTMVARLAALEKAAPDTTAVARFAVAVAEQFRAQPAGALVAHPETVGQMVGITMPFPPPSGTSTKAFELLHKNGFVSGDDTGGYRVGVPAPGTEPTQLLAGAAPGGTTRAPS